PSIRAESRSTMKLTEGRSTEPRKAWGWIQAGLTKRDASPYASLQKKRIVNRSLRACRNAKLDAVRLRKRTDNSAIRPTEKRPLDFISETKADETRSKRQATKDKLRVENRFVAFHSSLNCEALCKKEEFFSQSECS